MIDILSKYNFWDNQKIKVGFVREHYLNDLSKYLNNSLVKVILGQRRVGKSYLLRMIIHQLMTEMHVSPKNILYLNMDIQELDFIKNAEQLQKAINEYLTNLKPTGRIYVFLDEVQEIENWEKVVNSLSQDYTQDHEVFITGSNANLLSNELSTYLSGRYICFQIYPFSYKEFLDINQLKKSKESFIKYLQDGGIPESYSLSDQEMKTNYYHALRDSIVLRDIVQRYKVRDVYLLEKLMAFMIDSIGSLFSVNSVVNYMKSSGYKTNGETISSYIGFLLNSHFIHESERYDIKGKRILSGERKYYLNDLGFKYFLSSSFDFGIGKYLENAVFLHLKRNGYRVCTGRINGLEIDFIAEKNTVKKYFQVVYLLTDQAVIEREFGNLEQINDNYEKVVVSMDDANLGNRNGIIHETAWNFLCG
ncbi:MAG: ATP-binding protein [Proteobacteria bacterium]|nr:ATP-binding protein [Pseudomonadota bacterium]